jgi:hypothetical protein
VPTGREERIRVANARIFHLAFKAANALKDNNHKQLEFLEFKDDHGDGRPAYHEIVNEAGNVTQNVADLLQFAVVGFGKCGTTTLMDWISDHPRCQCFPEEVLDLMRSDPAALLAKLYTLPSGDFLRGYKSPLDLTMPHIPRQIAKLFPKTKLIVGLRHPIRWFESLCKLHSDSTVYTHNKIRTLPSLSWIGWLGSVVCRLSHIYLLLWRACFLYIDNFRVQNWNPAKHPHPFPPIRTLIGNCRVGTHNTCTQKGEFAIFLRNLGLGPTANSSQGQLDPNLDEETRNLVHFERLLFMVAGFQYESVAPLPNPVFLFEISQLHEENATRQETFQHDVSHFLGLPANQPLSLDLPHSKPGKSWPAPLQAKKDAAKVDICGDQYVDLRRVLLRQSRTTAVWLRRVLLPTGRVQVSDPEHFDGLLDQWMVDPCGPHESVNTAGKKILALLD